MSDVKNCARTLRFFMLAFLLSILVALPAAADERQALIVTGTEPPARINRALVLTGGEGPPVVLYAAENLTDAELEQFTVMAFVFKADGTLTARQVAPGRRTLEPREVKYSTLVLDGTKIDPLRHHRHRNQPGAARRLGILVAHRVAARRRSGRAAEKAVACPPKLALSGRMSEGGRRYRVTFRVARYSSGAIVRALNG